ncbi:hypothetical protein ACSNOK_10005 [Streptomyces sp. URMC 126]|uniref:hypothetical protein n=1 Tax=Streptomyces sp. URMC 126 TaxID=3423401 RepID=UPI003F1CABD2
MGLLLFPADGETGGPEVCFSYRGFGAFRRRLALAEGFRLDEMQGFGGDRSWTDVSTELEPLLDHPDDHGRSLSPQECRAMLPRLRSLADEWASDEPSDPELREHAGNAHDLVEVLEVCVRKNAELSFG